MGMRYLIWEMCQLLTLGVQGWEGGGGWLPPIRKVFLIFFIGDKTSAPYVFSSGSFIPHARFETSLAMVSYYGYEIWRHKQQELKPFSRKAWFQYDRPDRPYRPSNFKKFRDNPDVDQDYLLVSTRSSRRQETRPGTSPMSLGQTSKFCACFANKSNIMMQGTYREYSSKPLKHSIVEPILVFN